MVARTLPGRMANQTHPVEARSAAGRSVPRFAERVIAPKVRVRWSPRRMAESAHPARLGGHRNRFGWTAGWDPSGKKGRVFPSPHPSNPLAFRPG